MSDTTPATLSPEELEAIRQRAEKATPAPMIVRHCVDDYAGQNEYWFKQVDGEWDSTLMERREDAEFYAAARTDIPALLAHAAALKRELEAARGESKSAWGWYYRTDVEREAAIDRLIEIEEVFYDADGVACWKGNGEEIAKGWQEQVPAFASPPPSPTPSTESPAAHISQARSELAQAESLLRCQLATYIIGQPPDWMMHVYRKVVSAMADCSLAAPTPAAATPAPVGEQAPPTRCCASAHQPSGGCSYPCECQQCVAFYLAGGPVPRSLQHKYARQDAAAEKGVYK